MLTKGRQASDSSHNRSKSAEKDAVNWFSRPPVVVYFPSEALPRIVNYFGALFGNRPVGVTVYSQRDQRIGPPGHGSIPMLI